MTGPLKCAEKKTPKSPEASVFAWMSIGYTLPETNSKLAPENAWLEDELSYWVERPIFNCYVYHGYSTNPPTNVPPPRNKGLIRPY